MQYQMSESDQDPARVAEYVEWFRECPADVPPIVVMDGARIVDGHHRYLAAQAAGVTPRVSPLTSAQYAAAAAAGYDMLDIAAGAHLLAGADAAIDALDQQFPGAAIWERAEAVAALIG